MRQLLGPGVILASSLAVTAGCSRTSVDAKAASHQSGSVALVNGELFIAETDNGGVAVVDPEAETGAKAFIKTGSGPERIIARGGHIFVSNRFSRTVTQLDASSKQVVRQIAVGAEPMGIEVSPDGDLLYVTNAMSQSVQAIEVNSGATRWEAALNDEVRAVAVLPDGRLYVPGFKSAQVHVLDGKQGSKLGVLAIAPVPDSNPLRDRVPTSVEDVKVGPDGRIYLPHSQSTKTLVQPTPARPASVAQYYVTSTADRAGPAVTPGYTTIDPQLDVVIRPGPKVGTPVEVSVPLQAFAGPKVAVVDDSGEFMYSVNYLSNNVAVVPTRGIPADELPPVLSDRSGVLQFIPVGHGPNGIALSADQTRAYVYNSFEHSISVLAGKGREIVVERTISSIAPQTLSQAEQRGRMLFHDASSPRVTNPETGGISCASCHPGGREDGRTWQFAEGPRNTPSLVGKTLRETAPFHWDGAFADFEGIQHVLKGRMGGGGLLPSEFDDILTFLDGQPAPDNPFRAADGTLTEQQAHGKAIFEGKAACATCHSGATTTDNRAWDVGTSFQTIPIEQLERTPVVTGSERRAALPNTPSLHNIFATAPYLHDGSIMTLEGRVRKNAGDRHGVTSDLSDTEVKALVEYLKTL